MKHLIDSLVRQYDEDTLAGAKKPIALVGDVDAPFVRALRSKAKRLGVTTLCMDKYLPGMLNIIDVETGPKPVFMRPEDDMDHIMNKGISAVAQATLELLMKIGLAGEHVVIVGRGHAVRGLASRLLAEDASITVCHSMTTYLHDSTMPGSILVLATPPEVELDVCIYNKSVIIDIGNTLQGTLAASGAGYISGYELGKLTTSILMNRCIDHVNY